VTRADELVFATTGDGWRLALHRYRARGAAKARRRHPVVCCHGLGSNHVAFDVAEERSFAAYLAGRGYEVLALELRGHGVSERPRWGWSFDDYLVSDVPAAIDRARELTGADAVHWIGHSMGGLLLYAHLARGEGGALRSGITVGSSMDYSASRSGFHRMLPLANVLQRIPAVPVGLIARLSAPLAGRWRSPFEAFNVWTTNVDSAHWRTICERGFHAVSAPVMLQLASAMREGGLTSADGRTSYRAGLAQARVPVLAIGGDRDAQAPPDAVTSTLSALGSPHKAVRIFGPEHGHADHYGHFDLLIGRRARDEVYPHIDAWLDDADDPGRAPR
jgi:pimeloyl-ACP methyl ester carboxylesterase